MFANVLETHGYFNETTEESLEARGRIQEINIIGFDDNASIIEIIGEDIALTVMVNNNPNATGQSQTDIEFNSESYSWKGFFAVNSKRHD